MRLITVLLLTLSLTACQETKPVQDVYIKVDTVMTVVSHDGFICTYVRPPIPKKDDKLTCVWTSR